jgi:hypothetical protein
MFDEHCEFNDELLPHVLFGDISRWALETVGTRKGQDAVARLVDILNNNYREEDDPVSNLIAVSFLENLDRGTPGCDKIENLLAPPLRHQLIRFHPDA